MQTKESIDVPKLTQYVLLSLLVGSKLTLRAYGRLTFMLYMLPYEIKTKYIFFTNIKIATHSITKHICIHAVM